MRIAILLSLSAAFAIHASAAPKLRLVASTVGPVSIASGQNGNTQTVEAYNGGDGSLNLMLSTSANWLMPSVAPMRPCSTRPGTCIPLQITFKTTSLPAGAHSAFVSVNDPNAIDAPQTIAVLVQIGSAIPDRIDLYVPSPNSSDAFHFKTNSAISGTAATDNGKRWLSFTLDGAGTYTFVFPYRIVAQPTPDMGEGDYTGRVSVTGSSFPPDNKTTNVTLHITSRPIATSPGPLYFRVLQKTKVSAGIDLFNRGMGTLTIGGVTTSSDPGLSIAASTSGASSVALSIDPGSLGPGLYSGSVSISSNAANASVTVPLQVEVIAAGPPLITFQGVVNNATFEAGDPVAPGDLAALFGEQLSSSSPQHAASVPLATKLGGTRVMVNGQLAPLFYTSYGQITFQIPYETPPGEAAVQVERDGQSGNTVSVQMLPLAPRLLRLGIGDYGLIVNQDGTFPVPRSLGIGGHPAHVGDTLVIYAIGLGATDPPVPTGAGAPDAEPLARATITPLTVGFGSRLFNAAKQADPLFAGLTPGFVGLYQINVTVPEGTAANDELPVNVSYGTLGQIGSEVRIAIE